MSGADYTGHWDEKFRSRAWGRYPPEDLVIEDYGRLLRQKARTLLADILLQRLGTQGAFDRLLVGRRRLRRHDAGRVGTRGKRIGIDVHGAETTEC